MSEEVTCSKKRFNVGVKFPTELSDFCMYFKLVVFATTTMTATILIILQCTVSNILSKAQ